MLAESGVNDEFEKSLDDFMAHSKNNENRQAGKIKKMLNAWWYRILVFDLDSAAEVIKPRIL
jgi:hypothetical protein